jgi:hypothetical protein
MGFATVVIPGVLKLDNAISSMIDGHPDGYPHRAFNNGWVEECLSPVEDSVWPPPDYRKGNGIMGHGTNMCAVTIANVSVEFILYESDGHGNRKQIGTATASTDRIRSAEVWYFTAPLTEPLMSKYPIYAKMDKIHYVE